MKAPTTLGRRYQVVERLGRGAWGEVFLVEDRLEPGSRAALKTRRIDPFATADDRAAIAEGFGRLARVDHPNIARYLELGLTLEPGAGRSQIFLTRQHVEGVGVVDALEGASADDTVTAAITLCHALGTLHDHGVVHGNLSVTNVLGPRGVPGELRITDFGVAVTVGPSESSQISGLRGELSSVAPEVLRGASYSARADLYALGVVLHHAIAGRPPFEGPPAAIIQQHLDRPPPPLDAIRPDLPPALVSAVARLLAKDPARRPASAWDVVRALGGEPRPLPSWSVEPSLYGRAAELASLERLCRPGAGPRLVGVLGERGAGRTRLLRALRWRLALEGRAVLSVSCDRADDDPLAPLRALEAQLEILRHGEGAAGRLRSGRPSSPIADLSSLPRTTVQALDGAKAVLLVDDIDRASEPVVQVLLQASRALDDARDPGPMVLAGRPGVALERFFVEASRSERIVLPELELPETQRLVASLAGAARPALAATIRAHASGLPGQLLEVARAALERGETELDEPRDLPTDVQAAVRERLSRLGPRERVLLDLAAVAGEPLSWESLAPAPRGFDRDLFLETARALVRAGLLEEHDGRFDFVRTALREAVYAACPRRARRKLHRERWQRLAAEGEPLTGRRAIVVARHAVLSRPSGDDAERAASLAEAAAEELGRLGAAAAARDLLQSASNLVAGPTNRRLRLALARSLADSEKYEEAVATLSALAGEVEGADRGAVLARSAEVLHRAGAYEEAIEVATKAIGLAMSDEEKAERLTARASSRVERRHGAAAEADATVALELTGAPELRARLRALVGAAASLQGRHAEALELLEAVQADAALFADAELEAFIVDQLGAAAHRAGRHREALAAWTRGVELARERGELRSIPRRMVQVAEAHRALGEISLALDVGRQAMSVARRLGRGRAEVESNVAVAELAARAGAADEGREIALRAMLLARRRGDVTFEGRALLAMAECAVLQSPASGYGDAMKAAALFERSGARRWQTRAQIIAAELALWAGEPARAVEAAEVALAVAQQVDAPALLARARLVVSEARIARGEMAGAREVLDDLLAFPGEDADVEDLRWRALGAAATLATHLGESGRAAQLERAAVEALEASLGRVPPEYREALARHPARRALLQKGRARDGRPGLPDKRVFRLMEVNRAVLGERDPTKLLVLALDTAIELCGAERGFAAVLDVDGALRVEVARNLDRETLRSSTLEASREIAEDVARRGEPVLTVNASDDQRFSHLGSLGDMRLRSVACVPIRGRGGTIGTLYLDNRFESATFDEADLDLLLAFADVVAVALENARLADETSRLAAALERAREELAAAREQQAEKLQTALRELEATREAMGLKYDYSRIIGRSPGMLRIFQILDRIIDTHVPVLIQGESGTGKELIARAIHYNGPRKHGPFISVNCGAIPETLLESELFGHVRGAFTGATADRQGLLAAADEGTLFLDEIGDMSLAMQTKLLRALQEGEIRPVGATADRHVDVRVIAASHRDLHEEVAQGRFREDLFYRINVVRIELPPLRERREDIPLLAEHLLEVGAGELGGARKRISAEAMDELMGYDWPGNVRELENLLKNAAVLSSTPEIRPEDLPLTTGPRRVTAPEEDTFDLGEIERRTIERALEASGGNKKRAAELLGIARLTLYRKLERYRREDEG